MQLKVIAVNDAPLAHTISHEEVNGFDLSQFPEGGRFIGTAAMHAAGIWDMERIDGVLYVTLGQRGLAYECNPTGNSQDWRGTGEYIDASDYDPNHCYIVATSAPDGSQYARRQKGWTVAMPEPEKESVE